MKFVKSIRIKILACLIGISILPIIIIFTFTLRNNMLFYNRQISAASDNEVRAITSNINRTLENLDQLLTSLIFSSYDNDSVMLSICGMESGNDLPTANQRLLNYRMFTYICMNLIGNNEYAQGVYLFTESGYTYSFVKNREMGLEKNYQQAQWYNNLMEPGKLQVIDILQPGSTDNQHRQLVVLARRFTDVKGANTAILAIACNNDIFGGISDNSMSWSKSFLMDNTGNIIYGDMDHIDLTDSQLEAIAENRSGVIISSGIEAYVYGTLTANEWKIVSEVSLAPFYEFYTKNMNYLLVLIFVVIIIIGILLYVMEKLFVKPLVGLANIMQQTKRTDLFFRSNYKEREDEIGILYRCYETMMEEINRLIEEKYISEINYLKARLKSLTSQINAHCVFNTLENINCLANMENNKQIATMSKALGDMLRYSTEFEEDEVELRAEIAHIKQYIAIQEIRFGSGISLELDIEEGLLEKKVMKFMLQPIVENSIEHGLVGEGHPWIIIISVVRRKDKTIIYVKDNGLGMDEQTLKKVRNRICFASSVLEGAENSSIGLSNINKRLQLMYSERYGLEIDSQPNEGTTVTLTLPFLNGR